jgi:hypothetical protein
MNAENHVDPLVAFVHIPKAGGMSLTRLLTETYRERLFHGHPERGWPQTFSDTILADIGNKRFFYKAFIGHFAYGIHTVFNRETRYFSMVREPLERLESYYNFVRRWEIHHHHQKAQDLDIDSFFSYLIEINDIEISNLQCLMIAGDKNLDLALDRADKDFELIIPLSRVNEGIPLLCDRLNIARREMPEENTTTHVNKMNNLRKSVHETLVELNKGDALLYTLVCQKFDSLVALPRE